VTLDLVHALIVRLRRGIICKHLRCGGRLQQSGKDGRALLVIRQEKHGRAVYPPYFVAEMPTTCSNLLNAPANFQHCNGFNISLLYIVCFSL